MYPLPDGNLLCIPYLLLMKHLVKQQDCEEVLVKQGFPLNFRIPLSDELLQIFYHMKSLPQAPMQTAFAHVLHLPASALRPLVGPHQSFVADPGQSIEITNAHPPPP